MDRELVNNLVLAARDSSPVDGFTHNHYRYPARFSPWFARTVIELFTEPGDLVLDPFVGGGTTLVEALAHQRHAIGTDVSSLATFVSQVKTTLLSDREITKLRAWAEQIPEIINMHRLSLGSVWWEERGYQKHLDSKETWRLRKTIEQCLLSASNLRPMQLERLARCIILRTAQWALDSRKTIPTVQQFRDQIVEYANSMLEGALELKRSAMLCSEHDEPTSVICLNRSVAGLENDKALVSQPPPKLVLTSPPYPGIHVLYHRWQVDGRKETPAPFWIANMLDGALPKFYTMGDRKERELRSYYENVTAAYRSIRQICERSTIVVQVVAFGDAAWQMPKYLDVMSETGFEEILLPGINDSDDGRLWRNVPNRKWHADQMGDTPGSREVVLIHAPAPIKQPLQRSPTNTPCRRPGR